MNNAKGFALARIAFGMVWAVDAYLKWLPGFFTTFVSYFTAALPSQPMFEEAWLHFWIALITPHAFFFALMTAILETLIAFSLLLGFYTRTFMAIGIVLSFLIWTLPEGLGGPYSSGATDISAGLIYVFVFATLWLGHSWRAYSIDNFIAKRFPSFFVW
jgi:thiosulfate dehydrogenase [quinone] large subunit